MLRHTLTFALLVATGLVANEAQDDPPMPESAQLLLDSSVDVALQLTKAATQAEATQLSFSFAQSADGQSEIQDSADAQSPDLRNEDEDEEQDGDQDEDIDEVEDTDSDRGDDELEDELTDASDGESDDETDEDEDEKADLEGEVSVELVKELEVPTSVDVELLLQAENSGESHTNSLTAEGHAETEVRVISLKYSAAGPAEEMVRKVFPDADLIVQADERTNRLVLRGSPTAIRQVSQLIEQIDRDDDHSKPKTGRVIEEERVMRLVAPGGAELRAGVAPQQRPGTPPGKARLVKEYRVEFDPGQRELAILTDQIRQLRRSTDPNEEELARLEDQLRDKVREAFDARQTLQRAELAVLQEQLKSIEETIDARERDKDQLVQQRVKDLVSGEGPLQIAVPPPGAPGAWVPGGASPWAGPPGGLPHPPIPHPAAPAFAHPPVGPRPEAPPGAAVPLAPPVAPQAPAPATSNQYQNADNPEKNAAARFRPPASADQASPLDLMATLKMLRTQQDQLESALKRMRDESPRGVDNVPDAHRLEAQLRDVQHQLEDVARQDKLLGRKIASQKHLAELQLKSAELNAAAAQEAADDAQKRHESGLVPFDELRRLKLNAEQARIQLEQASEVLRQFQDP
jgi:hypothetical protein